MIELGEWIQMDFHPVFIDDIVNGLKTATTRRGVKGVPGDVFTVTDAKSRTSDYVIREVHLAPAEVLCRDFHDRENITCSEGMFEVLKGIYPDLTPDTILCTHVFERADLSPLMRQVLGVTVTTSDKKQKEGSQ